MFPDVRANNKTEVNELLIPEEETSPRAVKQFLQQRSDSNDK